MKCASHLLIILMVFLSGCRSEESKESSESHSHERLVLEYVDSGWNARDTPELSNILSENFVRNLNGLQVVQGVMEMQAYIQNYLNAFPNLKITVEQIVKSDKQVVAVWIFEGTNTGEFGEFTPTGKKARVSGISLFTFAADGKISQEDTFYNELYLLQQLGYTLKPPNLE